MIDLKMKTERFEARTYVVSVAGELDLYTAPAFEHELLAAVGGGAAALIVDLTGCDFLDSTALGVLLKARQQLADSAAEVSLVTSDRTARKVFEITGCDRLFPIHATRALAMNGGLHRASSWEDDEARTRAVFRLVNERIAEQGVGLDLDERRAFICECGNRECASTIELTRAEYEGVRAHARRFVLAPDHENPTLEIVISENGRSAVTETLVGEASRIPEETNPRLHPDSMARETHERSAYAS